ncbi:MAG: nicotinate-nucleotide diphosphorylase [Cycloclasticus sp. symbiont of Poecilosclerida sp. M]|nr:MAG: nicotinate-nucleotide diphosphorylase [Cycloclasticus sp. symbiont of Poecilosclerida sp. M]
MPVVDQKIIDEDVRHFLAEDVGSGDLTAMAIDENKQAKATLISREVALISGHPWFQSVFSSLDSTIQIDWQVVEGAPVDVGGVICTLSGSARALLTGERAAINIMQTLSATTSLAGRYAKAVEGTKTVVLDTRKTIPGLRMAQKYAVRCGGCKNHRMGLYDGILIKENHILAAGGIKQAVIAARKTSASVAVEVEVETLDEVQQALEAQADILLLDNFTIQQLKQAVALNKGWVMLEASGNVDLTTVRKIANTGVDYVSVGALTKNIQAIDLSMCIDLQV